MCAGVPGGCFHWTLDGFRTDVCKGGRARRRAKRSNLAQRRSSVLLRKGGGEFIMKNSKEDIKKSFVENTNFIDRGE